MRYWSSRLVAVLAAGTVIAAVPATADAAAGGTAVSVGCQDTSALIEAVEQANATGTGTIVLARHCTYTLTEVFPGDQGDNALPQITGQITIEGNGATLARAATAAPMRILEVSGNGSLTINDVTLTNGDLTGDATSGGDALVLGSGAALTLVRSEVTGGTAEYGGGISNGVGSLTVERSQVTGNTARQGGGGIAVFGPPLGGTSQITDSQVTGNTAGGGGALWSSGEVIVVHTRLTGNTANREGSGGLDIVGGFVTLRSDMISRNHGGGITNVAMLHLISTVIKDNIGAPGGGSGSGIANYGTADLTRSQVIANDSPTSGGGIENSGTMSLDATTVSGNTAETNGGGIDNTGMLQLDRSSVVHNTARTGEGGGIYNTGTVSLQHSQVVANQPDNCAPVGSVPGCTG